jgi:hypothetical protein
MSIISTSTGGNGRTVAGFMDLRRIDGDCQARGCARAARAQVAQ